MAREAPPLGVQPSHRLKRTVPCTHCAVAAAEAQDVDAAGQQQQKKRKAAAPAAAAAAEQQQQPAAPAAEQPPAAQQADADERDSSQRPAKKSKGKDAAGPGDAVERQVAAVSGIMSAQTFDQLELTEQTRKGVAEMGFTNMTEVQARTIPQLLVGRDVLGAAKTGETCAGGKGSSGCGGSRFTVDCNTCNSAASLLHLHPLPLLPPFLLLPGLPLPAAVARNGTRPPPSPRCLRRPRLRQDASLPHPLHRAAVPRQVPAAQRHRGHHHLARAGAGAAGGALWRQARWLTPPGSVCECE